MEARYYSGPRPAHNDHATAADMHSIWANRREEYSFLQWIKPTGKLPLATHTIRQQTGLQKIETRPRYVVIPVTTMIPHDQRKRRTI
jgi:hypothetical protein